MLLLSPTLMKRFGEAEMLNLGDLKLMVGCERKQAATECRFFR